MYAAGVWKTLPVAVKAMMFSEHNQAQKLLMEATMSTRYEILCTRVSYLRAQTLDKINMSALSIPDMSTVSTLGKINMSTLHLIYSVWSARWWQKLIYKCTFHL